MFLVGGVETIGVEDYLPFWSCLIVSDPWERYQALGRLKEIHHWMVSIEDPLKGEPNQVVSHTKSSASKNHVCSTTPDVSLRI